MSHLELDSSQSLIHIDIVLLCIPILLSTVKEVSLVYSGKDINLYA